MICKMPAAFSLYGANNSWLTLLSIQQEKMGSLHHLPFLQLAISWPRVYNENGNDECLNMQSLRLCLSKVPARLGHLCSPDRFEISLLPLVVTHCFAIPKACPLWKYRLPSLLAACEHCSPWRPHYVQLTTYCFSCFREGVPCISKSII